MSRPVSSNGDQGLTEAGGRREYDKAGKSPQQTLAPCHVPAPDRISTREQQRKADRGQDIGADRESIALKAFLRLPLALVTRRVVLILGDYGMAMRCRRCRGGGLAFVDLALLDQRHGPEELCDRNNDADDQAGKRGRKYDRPENRHLSSMTGKRVGVADIVRGVMNRTDMREADHADDE